jgi:SAM-dependent methyltransferase
VEPDAGTLPEQPISVDDLGVLLLDLDDDAVMDVLFDGQRVWSFNPRRDGRVEDAGRRVPWPRGLRPVLNGYAHIQVVQHLSGRRRFERTVTFGSGERPIRLVDKRGRKLVANKLGDLMIAAFADSPETATVVTTQVRQILELMREQGVDAYVCYGLLLGAVRTGHVIGHDDDGDVAYLSRADNPVGVLVESYRLERMFQRAGWRTTRNVAGYFYVHGTAADGRTIHLDVFASFHWQGTFFVVPFVRGQLGRDKILPLGSVQLEGQRLPAPADPDALLALIYGPGWRVPDPSFRYLSSAPVHAMGAQLGGGWHYSNWWDRYYKTNPVPHVPAPAPEPAMLGAPPPGEPAEDSPSELAQWVARHEPHPTSVVEAGCGPGVDGHWLARRGHLVRGLDIAPFAIATARQRRGPADAEDYQVLDFFDTRKVLALGAALVREPDRPRVVYSRWLIDSMNGFGRANLLTFAAMLLRGTGGHLYLEARLPLQQWAAKWQAFAGQKQAVLTLAALREEIIGRGGIIEDSEQYGQVRNDTGVHPARCRMKIRWDG